MGLAKSWAVIGASCGVGLSVIRNAYPPRYSNIAKPNKQYFFPRAGLRRSIPTHTQSGLVKKRKKKTWAWSLPVQLLGILPPSEQLKCIYICTYMYSA